MAYGSLVVQLIQDYEDYAEVNKQLEKMYAFCIFGVARELMESDVCFMFGRGYNIGVRLIEDFVARSGLGKCADFKEVGEVVAKVSFFPIDEINYFNRLMLVLI